MLRITRIADGDSSILKLEGSLRQPWIDELGAACSETNGRAIAPALDLASVTFVDQAGVALLQQLQQQGCRIIACSRFVATLLHLEIP